MHFQGRHTALPVTLKPDLQREEEWAVEANQKLITFPPRCEMVLEASFVYVHVDLCREPSSVLSCYFASALPELYLVTRECCCLNARQPPSAGASLTPKDHQQVL